MKIQSIVASFTPVVKSLAKYFLSGSTEVKRRSRRRRTSRSRSYGLNLYASLSRTLL